MPVDERADRRTRAAYDGGEDRVGSQLRRKGLNQDGRDEEVDAGRLRGCCQAGSAIAHAPTPVLLRSLAAVLLFRSRRLAVLVRHWTLLLTLLLRIVRLCEDRRNCNISNRRRAVVTNARRGGSKVHSALKPPLPTSAQPWQRYGEHQRVGARLGRRSPYETRRRTGRVWRSRPGISLHERRQ